MSDHLGKPADSDVHGGDPRLEIPELLRTPVPKPEYDPSSSANSSQPSAADVRGMGKAWAIALDFVFTVLAGLLLGWGLDKWKGTSPWGLLGGMVVGFTAALVVIVRQASKEDRASKR